MADIKYVGGGSINLSRSLKSSCFAIKQIGCRGRSKIIIFKLLHSAKDLVTKFGLCKNWNLVQK